jgi:hypothetical protein
MIAVRVCPPLLLMLVLSACSPDPPDVEDLTCGETFKDIPVGVNYELDLLLVIDTAPSMAGVQESLMRNVTRFANVLESLEGGLPDLHIAIITSDLGAGGFAVAGCSGSGSGGVIATPTSCGIDGDFLVDERNFDGTRTRNYAGTFADAFSCMAAVDVGTCAIRQPIAAAVQALADDRGFLRENSHLGVLFITDGDDCSAASPALFDPANTSLPDQVDFRCFTEGVICDPDQPLTAGSKDGCVPRTDGLVAGIEDLEDALRAYRPDPGMISIGVASGADGPVVVQDAGGELSLAPACTSAYATAGPAVRLGALLDSFPQRNTLVQLCNEDLSDLFVLYAQLLAVVLGNPCLEGDIDRDPVTPGPQVECSVSDIRFPGSDLQEENLIPLCSDTDDLPCWRLEEDPINCPDVGNGLSLEVDRADFPLPGTHVVIRCLTLC